MTKVSLLAPLPPFRGGIARHSGRLAQEIASREGLSLSAYTFSRLYPSWLYPGTAQVDESQRACPAAAVLDSVWPPSWRRTARIIAASNPDMVIMPVWTFFVAPALGRIARSLRQQNVPVTMIVHNAFDHEMAGWKRRIVRYQLAQADVLVTHNDAIAKDILALLPSAKVAVSPHPIYDDYPAPTGRLKREAALELLFFGLVRRYKGLDIAVRALAASGLSDVRLTVAGEFWEGRKDIEQLVASLKLDNKVEIVPRYVTDNEAAEYFERADAVLLPYRSVSGSGVVALAQHYRRPIIASDLPGLAGTVKHDQTGWLFPSEDYHSLAELFKNRVSRDNAAAMSTAVEDEAGRLSWGHFVDTILQTNVRASD